MQQIAFIFIVMCLCVLSPWYARAAVLPSYQQDQVEKERSISTRKHPDYDPVGVRADDFIISPSIKAERQYNDNIYYADKAMVSDAMFVLSPNVEVKSDFVRHEVQANMGVEEAKFDSLSGENYTDYHAGVGGRVDVTGRVSVPLSLRYRHEHSKRSSPDDRFGLEPTEYDHITQKTGVTYANKNFTIAGVGGLENYTYQDTPSLAGIINNQDRNRTVFSGGFTLGMPEEGIIVPFAYSRMKDVDYDAALDDTGVNRDSTEMNFGIGTDVNISSILYAKLKVGSVSREMSDARLANASGLEYAADITWEPSTLASFTLTGEKSIEETTLAGFSMSVDNSLSLTAKYELAPNIIISPNLEYLIKDYQGGSGGSVEYSSAGLGITYKLNRNLWTDLTYRYAQQDVVKASRQLTGFETNIIMLSLTAHY